MNLNEFEEKIKAHGKNVKKYVAPPFDIEREDLNNMKKSTKIKVSFLLSAVIVCVLAVTAFAAYNYLTAKQVADKFDDPILADNFKENEIQVKTIKDGKYKVTLLGLTSGKNISKFESSSWELFPDRTYAAVAVEKTDGSAMTYDDEVLVTPLIEGLAPWQYNICTMNGGWQGQIIDGVLYRIVDFDSIEYFADKHIYLAVLDQTFYSIDAYNYDEKTGLISVKESYDGTNILFDLNVDKSKADPVKAEEYLDKINKEMEGSDDDSENPEDNDNDTGDLEEEIKHIEIATDGNGKFVITEK